MPQNGINSAGVMALASAMRHNRELRVLNFNDNTFTKKGTLAMAQVSPVSRSAQKAADKCVGVGCAHAFSAVCIGPETPEEPAGGQLGRLPGSF